MKKKITTAKIQESKTNVWVSIPKLVREIFDISKGDTMEVFIDTDKEEIIYRKKK